MLGQGRPNSEIGGKVSPIGDLLSHTAKSKSDEAYEQVMDTLREIAFMWHQDEFQVGSGPYVQGIETWGKSSILGRTTTHKDHITGNRSPIM